MTLTPGSALAGKVALVTGAASGIGRAVALALVGHGVTLALVDRDAEGLARVAEEAGGRVARHCLDIADEHAVAAAVEAVSREFGVIEILVNSAGVGLGSKTLLETSPEDWARIHDVNLRAPFLFIREVGRRMLDAGAAGRIVNISSSGAFRAQAVNGAYAASKAGLGGLTRIAAGEFGPAGITVNAVAPGLTDTPIAAAISAERKQALVGEGGPLANLTRRVSEPEDVASAVVFLCLPEARQITGQTLHVSGGQIV